MTNNQSDRPRRGLAISSMIVGAIAILMIVGFWILGRASDGQGLSSGSVLAVFFYYASVVVGVTSILLGIAAVILSRPRFYGIVGIILGLVPVIAVAVSFSSQAG